MPQITKKTLTKREFILKNHAHMSDEEMARELTHLLDKSISRQSVKSMRQRMGLVKIPTEILPNKRGWNYIPAHQQLDRPYKDKEFVLSTPEIEKIKTEHKEMRETLDLISKVEMGLRVHKIDPPKETGRMTRAAAVWVASDWHLEEGVKPEWVNNLNHHDLRVSQNRSKQFFEHGLRLTDMLSRDVHLERIVLALLGDFITNDIHEEMKEVNLLTPMEAILFAQEQIASGIQYILDNSSYELTLVCASGNHGRTTDENYYSTEYGHSLEHYMYRSLAKHFENNKRVQIIINNAYHTILDLYGYRIRFHHGHAIRYGGGVGGLYIPVNKKISQWNHAIPVNLDVFGHFHTYRDGGTFVSNGSQIGYNAYALRNGLPFERPQQALFLVDEKRGKTISAPILYED